MPVEFPSPVEFISAVNINPTNELNRLNRAEIDLPFFRRYVNALEDAGFDVAVAADGQEALAQLSEERYDCLVTDVEMPGMDGYDLTRNVRATPALAHLPIVVVTTHDRPDERLKGLAAGADAYLAKQGLDARELVALVRRLGGL